MRTMSQLMLLASLLSWLISSFWVRNARDSLAAARRLCFTTVGSIVGTALSALVLGLDVLPVLGIAVSGVMLALIGYHRSKSVP